MKKLQEKATVNTEQQKPKNKKHLVISHTEKTPSGICILRNFDTVDEYLNFSKRYGK